MDSSTQSVKAVLVEADTGQLVAQAHSPHPPGTEVDPQAWWDALLEVLASLPSDSAAAAISIAGQQHGLVALGSDGAPLRPALLWNDTRSAQAAQELIEALGPEGASLWAERTGSVPKAFLTVAKVYWMAQHEPELAGRIAALALPHDWLTWRLRGYGPHNPDLTALTTDRSDASGTGYFNVNTSEWDRELLQLALGERAQTVVLPAIVAPEGQAGTVSAEVAAAVGSLSAQSVVGAGAGDNASAALGLGIEEGDVVISLGTSGTVFTSAGHRVMDPSGTLTCFADASGGYLPIVTTMNAARVIDVSARMLRLSLDEFSQLALAAPPGAQGIVMLPYFDGERTPNLPNAHAQLLGLSNANMSSENVARAAVEGMLCGLAVGFDALTTATQPARRILLIGGAAQSRAVQAVARDIFSAPISIPEPGQYVALGAARQAGWALSSRLPLWHAAHSSEIDADPAPQDSQAAEDSRRLGESERQGDPGVREQFQRAFAQQYGSSAVRIECSTDLATARSGRSTPTVR